MRSNTFHMVHILFSDRRGFSQYRRILLGLFLLLCTFSSSYSQVDGYYHEIAQEPTPYNSTALPSTTLRADVQEVAVALIDSGYGIGDTDTITDFLWINQAEANGIAGIDDDENGFIDDIHGWDWIGDDGFMDDELGHGTLVGNTILDTVEQHATDQHAIKIQPLRILRGDGKGEIVDLVDAIAYALRQGIRIASLTLVSYYDAPALEQAIKIAAKEGLLMIAPIGNLATRVYWPAAYPETLAVGTVNHLSNDSCSSGGIDVMVSSDDTTSNSDATASVTAVVALLLFQHPDWSNETIISTILSTADYTSGMPPHLDIDAALNAGLTFDPPRLDFGSIVTGTAKTLTLEVTNITTETETYQLDTLELDALTFDQQSITLAPNSSATVSVTIDAAASRVLGQNLTLVSLTSEERKATLVACSQIISDQAGPSGQEGQIKYYLPFVAR